MRKIIGYLKDYFRNECNYKYAAILILFVATCTYINFGIVSEDVWIKADSSTISRLVKYLVGYATVFGGAYALQMLIDKDPALRSPKLWGLIIFAIILFSVRAWYMPSWPLVTRYFPSPYGTVAYKFVINALGFVFLFIPLGIYWGIADRNKEQLYGFHAKGVVLWPYFVLILLMLPLLFAAGSQPDFQAVYPRANHLYIPKTDQHYWLATLAYESVYSIDYVVTEFFFRGFLIIPFVRIIGPKAILPMCAFYVSIHFDKPMGEAISSFFGGLLLGVLAYRTRSMYGGVIVHLGIALCMELVGWWYIH